ncbi:MAG: outer membrane lipoprotein carrier protein LolA [Cyclobacteriaceae bacterium]
MKKTILTLLVLGFTTFVSAQYDPEALAVLDAMSATYKKIDAFKASFTVKLVNKEAALDESNSGKITVKGDMFVLDVADQKIFNNGTDVYTYSAELAEVTISTYESEEAEITLGNVYDLYKEGFKYALIAKMDNGDRVIELDPESRDKSYFKIRMIIDRTDKLKSFTVYERTNNVYTYAINEFEAVTVDDKFFTFDTAKYPNVEVIDFR